MKLIISKHEIYLEKKAIDISSKHTHIHTLAYTEFKKRRTKKMQRIKSALHEVKLVYCYPRELNFYRPRIVYKHLRECVWTELWVDSAITYECSCICVCVQRHINIYRERE